MQKSRAWSAVIFVLGLAIIAAIISPIFTIRNEETPATVSLLDRARLGTWYSPAKAEPAVITKGYEPGKKNDVEGFQESDFLYANGKYYLFATASQEPALTSVYTGDTIEGLIQGGPDYADVAHIRYPTVVKDGDTWHMWGVNPKRQDTLKWTEHWTSKNAEPTDFVYADTIFPDKDAHTVVDFAVRKHPTNGYWYGVGFEDSANSPLLLLRASGPSGPWEKLNYIPKASGNGVFGETGAPPWANASRPDPNLAFTSDGSAWIFFTGKPSFPQTKEITWRAGLVQVDIESGKALGNAVVLYDPASHKDMPFTVASDLNLVSVPGEPDRIFAYANSADYPLVVLDVPDSVSPHDGRTSADLVRLDMVKGYDVAPGMVPMILQPPYQWSEDGLIISANEGEVGGYLASAYLGDLTIKVDFTPMSINQSAINMVAYIGGANYEVGPGIAVQIGASSGDSLITAVFTGKNKARIVLNSGITAVPNSRYDVEISRTGSNISMRVNGSEYARAMQDGALTGLQGWSLTAEQTISQPPRNPFQGTIHEFTVVGNTDDTTKAGTR